MSETLEYSVQLAGAENAARAIDELKSKQQELATQATSLARQVMEAEQRASQATGEAASEADAQLGLLIQKLNETQAAAARYGQQAQQLQAAQRQATQATQAATAAQQQATQATQANGEAQRQATEHTIRFGQAASTVGAGLQRMGREFAQTRPEIAAFTEHIGQVTSSLGQNVQAFGPWGGAVVTALESVAPVLAHSIDQWSHFDTLLAEARAGLAGMSDVTDRMLGVGTAHGVSNLAGQTAEQSAQAGRIAADRAARNAIPSGVDIDELIHDSTPAQIRALGIRTGGGRGGGGGDTLQRALTEYDRALQQGLQRQQALRDAARAEEQAKGAIALEQASAQEAAHTSQVLEIDRQLEDNRRALAQQDRDMAMQRWEATRPLYDAERQSVESLITAYNHANETLTRMHQQTLASGELWAHGMTALGNEVANTIGGDLTSAFSSSLDAWLSGSKSFVQAAEEMAKGVLKSLTEQAIVQAIAETARGIADLASYQYATAGLHFAAAGTWAAIGAVSGGVGAAVGAFGGSSAGASTAGAGAGSSSRASLGSGATAAMQPTNVTIALFAPHLSMSAAEQGQFIASAVRQTRRALGTGAVRFATT